MKTVMQEFIDKLDKGIHDAKELNIPHLPEALEEIKITCIELLKKEKQRLFHCFNAGADRVCDKEFNQWFDQTYNQNK